MNDDIRPVKRRAQVQPVHNHVPTPVFNSNDFYETHHHQPKADYDINDDNEDKPTKKSRYQFLKWRPTKKQSLIGAGVLVLLLITTGGIILALHKSAPPVKTNKTIAKPNIPANNISNTVASTLTGLPVNPSVNSGPVTGVIIENSTDARPQSGLSQAGVVFEALAEGGITRYLALFQNNGPSYIGPIRSARPYFLQWDLGFDAPFAHVGGSPEALADIKSWGVEDMDQFYNGSYFQRISSRPQPHNVYTSISKLTELETSLGYTSSSFTPWPRKSDSPSPSPTATSINFNPAGPDFAVSYNYNSTNDSYERSLGGVADTDLDQAGNQTQIDPKVVIGLVVPWSQGPADGIGAYYSEYATVGSGAAYIFQDGTLTIGTWTKSSNTSQIVFKNSTGASVKLNAGQTWITVLGSTSQITYS